MGNSKRNPEGDGPGRGKSTGKARSARPRKSVQTGKSAKATHVANAPKAAPVASADGEIDEAATPSFETALERLEVSVARLEEGEMPLGEALELFESGVKLSRQCQSTLDQAERRIEILVADRGLKLDDVGAGAGDGIVDFDFESDEDVDDESAFED